MGFCFIFLLSLFTCSHNLAYAQEIDYSWTLSDNQRKKFIEYYSPIILKQANETRVSEYGRYWMTNFYFDGDSNFSNNRVNWTQHLDEYINGEHSQWQIRPTIYTALLEFNTPQAGRPSWDQVFSEDVEGIHHRKSLVLIYHVYHAVKEGEGDERIHNWRRIEIRLDFPIQYKGSRTHNGDPGHGERINYVVISDQESHILVNSPNGALLNFHETAYGKHLILWEDQNNDLVNTTSHLGFKLLDELNTQNVNKVDVHRRVEDQTFHYVFVPESDPEAVSYWKAKAITQYNAASFTSRLKIDEVDDLPNVPRITYELQDIADILFNIQGEVQLSDLIPGMVLWVPDALKDEKGQTLGNTAPRGKFFYSNEFDNGKWNQKSQIYLTKPWFWGTSVAGMANDFTWSYIGNNAACGLEFAMGMDWYNLQCGNWWSFDQQWFDIDQHTYYAHHGGGKVADVHIDVEGHSDQDVLLEYPHSIFISRHLGKLKVKDMLEEVDKFSEKGLRTEAENIRLLSDLLSSEALDKMPAPGDWGYLKMARQALVGLSNHFYGTNNTKIDDSEAIVWAQRMRDGIEGFSNWFFGAEIMGEGVGPMAGSWYADLPVDPPGTPDIEMHILRIAIDGQNLGDIIEFEGDRLLDNLTMLSFKGWADLDDFFKNIFDCGFNGCDVDYEVSHEGTGEFLPTGWHLAQNGGFDGRWAQLFSDGTSKISGQLTTLTTYSLNNLEVQLRSYNGNEIFSKTRSTADGRFQFVNIKNGTYQIKPMAPSGYFFEGAMETIVVNDVDKTTTNFSLKANQNTATTNSCFIATAAYGSPMAKEVDSLRDFRDGVLLKTKFGQESVAWYYRTSPPIADELAKYPNLRAGVRAVLTPLVRFSQWIRE